MSEYSIALNTTNSINANNEILTSMQSHEIEKYFINIYKHSFIETPFAQRFQGFIKHVRMTKKWAIIGAYSRNGKSWCIKDIVKNSGAVKEYTGKTYAPIIAIRSPESSNSSDIISSLCRCFGTLPKSNNSVLKKWLIDSIPNFGVEQIIIDDAHELNINHFKFIKWLTDTLELEKNYYLSIVLSSIVSGNAISAWRKIQQYKGEDWMYQFYERFSLFREIQGHTPQEVAQILYAYDELYKTHLPNINLTQYAINIFGWLTNSELDIHKCHRVAMEHLAKLVYEAARLACIEYNMKEIPGDLLFHVFNVYLLNKDKFYSTENEPIYKKNKLITELKNIN